MFSFVLGKYLGVKLLSHEGKCNNLIAKYG